MSAPVQVGPSPDGGGPVPSLSPRDVEFLECLTRGQSAQEIARAWVYEERSVRRIAERIRTKLGAKTNEQAVFLACQLGVLQPRRRHGDHAGFAAHRYRKEDPCDECWEGERAYRRGAKAARRAAKTASTTRAIGTS